MSQLLPCPHCSRHHRVCDPVCPFCGGALPSCKGAPSAMSPHGRMNRATLVAAGAALLGAAACDKSVVPPYGGFYPPGPPQDASADASQGTDADTSDASAADDSKAPQDATDAKDGGAEGS
jgi:hypothetical protein